MGTKLPLSFLEDQEIGMTIGEVEVVAMTTDEVLGEAAMMTGTIGTEIMIETVTTTETEIVIIVTETEITTGIETGTVIDTENAEDATPTPDSAHRTIPTTESWLPTYLQTVLGKI